MKEKNSNIILCGFMASGKSSVAKLLAARLNMPFIDSDELIIKNYGLGIPEIFEKGGESLFRELEFEATKELASLKSHVIATGGGLLTFERNFEVLKNSGLIIYLERSFESIYETIKGDEKRPLASTNTKQTLLALYEERSAKYKVHSHIRITNNGSIEDCVKKICEYLKKQEI